MWWSSQKGLDLWQLNHTRPHALWSSQKGLVLVVTVASHYKTCVVRSVSSGDREGTSLPQGPWGKVYCARNVCPLVDPCTSQFSPVASTPTGQTIVIRIRIRIILFSHKIQFQTFSKQIQAKCHWNMRDRRYYESREEERDKLPAMKQTIGNITVTAINK